MTRTLRGANTDESWKVNCPNMTLPAKRGLQTPTFYGMTNAAIYISGCRIQPSAIFGEGWMENCFVIHELVGRNIYHVLIV